MKIITTLLLCAVFQLTSFATTYTSTGNKSWATSGFPSTVAQTDTLNIINGDSITLSANITINGVINIGVNCILDGTNKIKIGSTGKLVNNGTIDINKELHIDGSFINYSQTYVEALHSDGYIYNSGQIKLFANEEFKHHGGELEGCGTILTDLFNISANSKVSLNGRPEALTTCQNFCNTTNTDTPTFNGQTTEAEFLNNTDTINSVIDSTIAICFAGVLPVSIIEFQVELVQDMVQLNWSTATEANNAGFDIERSLDGSHWEFVTHVGGAGHSNTVLNYSAFDISPLSGESFYRLKQIDFDGTLNYTNPKRINVNSLANSGILIYPNPSSTNITVVSKNIGHDQLIITSILGEFVSSDVFFINTTGAHSLELDITALKSGMYILTLGNKQFRFIKE